MSGLDIDEEFELHSNRTSVIVADLHPFSQYKFTIAAQTITQIIGPFSSSLVLQMPEAGRLKIYLGSYIISLSVSRCLIMCDVLIYIQYTTCLFLILILVRYIFSSRSFRTECHSDG